MLFGWSGLAAPAYVDPADGGHPGWLAPQLVLTDPGLDAAQYPPPGGVSRSPMPAATARRRRGHLRL